MDSDVKWFSMPLGVQISNVGSEVNRAIRYRNKNDRQKAENFCDKAVEFLEIMKRDPKNTARINEFNAAIDELNDYFKGNNTYQTTDRVLTRYYDAFLYTQYN